MTQIKFLAMMLKRTCNIEYQKDIIMTAAVCSVMVVSLMYYFSFNVYLLKFKEPQNVSQCVFSRQQWGERERERERERGVGGV